MNVGSLLTSNARRYPNKTALMMDHIKLTYLDLNKRVNSLANSLISQGLQKNHKASIYISNCIEWAEIYFALSKIGVVIVPINPRLRGKELIHMIHHSDSQLLFFDKSTRQNVLAIKNDLRKYLQYIYLGETSEDSNSTYNDLFKSSSSDEPNVPLSHDDVHSICYTSGTTGLPKGAVLTNLNVISVHYYMTSSEFGVTRDDIFLMTTPLSQRIGWGKLINSISLGCTLAIMPHFDAEKAMQIIAKEKVTIVSIVPSIGRLLLQLPNLKTYNASSIKLFFVTGEAFPIEVKKNLIQHFPNAKLVSYFASTEAGLVTSIMHENILTSKTSVGYPLPGVDVRIINSDGNEVQTGIAGEILTKTGQRGMFSVMKEYYKDPDKTEETFSGDWLKIGDIGMFDARGELHLIDRKKDMIISGGFNIYSREVEAVLEGNEKVKEAAVVGVPDTTYGEAVKAFIVLKNGAVATQEEIIDYCRNYMASYKKPKYVAFIEELPRNDVGKVLKYTLKTH